MSRWAAHLALAFTCSGAVCSAQTTGRIEGTVRDAAGAPLPGVAIEATSPSLQGARTAVTDHHADAREGMTAFREKRKARFNRA